MSEYTPTPEEARDAYIEAQYDAAMPDSVSSIEHGRRFDRMIAEVERAAAARALEEVADQMNTGYNSETLNAERRAIKREERARAAEVRGAALAPVTEEGGRE